MGNKGHEGVREIKGKLQVIYRSHSPQSEEGWIEIGGDSERCKWTVVDRKRGEEKMG